MLQQPLAMSTIPLPGPQQKVDNFPPSAPGPAIAVIDKTSSSARPESKNAVACPCSDQCTCGCQSGKPCRCSQDVAAPPPVRQPAPPSITALPTKTQVVLPPASNREWVLNGRPWTRQSLLDHLYNHANHRHAYGSLDHLGIAQLQAMHNAEHEHEQLQVARPARQIIQRTAQPIFAKNDCPNGQCPPWPRTQPILQTYPTRPFVSTRNCPNGQCPIQ